MAKEALDRDVADSYRLLAEIDEAEADQIEQQRGDGSVVAPHRGGGAPSELKRRHKGSQWSTLNDENLA